METRTIICLLACVFGIAQVTNASEGALRGKFAISATDTVAFSRGNLQYRPSTDTWRLAENQWEFVGTANGRIRSYQYSSEGWVWTYEGWLDLFGWGTGNNPTASSAKNSNYGTYSEWGNNAIQNGGNARNLWRTLSKEEWNYLYSGRIRRFALCQRNGERREGFHTAARKLGYTCGLEFQGKQQHRFDCGCQ